VDRLPGHRGAGAAGDAVRRRPSSGCQLALTTGTNNGKSMIVEVPPLPPACLASGSGGNPRACGADAVRPVRGPVLHYPAGRDRGTGAGRAPQAGRPGTGRAARAPDDGRPGPGHRRTAQPS
jgi:hypothetical protein